MNSSLRSGRTNCMVALHARPSSSCCVKRCSCASHASRHCQAGRASAPHGAVQWAVSPACEAAREGRGGRRVTRASRGNGARDVCPVSHLVRCHEPRRRPAGAPASLIPGVQSGHDDHPPSRGVPRLRVRSGEMILASKGHASLPPKTCHRYITYGNPGLAERRAGRSFKFF